MKIYYFDTSALNHLLDSDQCDCLSSFHSLNIFFLISVFTVAEIASTENSSRRTSLLQLAKIISSNYGPFAFSKKLLRRSLESVKTWAHDMDYTMSHKLYGVWRILNDPSLIDDRVFKKLKFQQETWFNDMHERDRQHLQKVLSSAPISHKFRNYSDLHRYHSPDKQPNKDFVYDIALRLLLNEPVTYDLVDRILVHFEHWWFFLSSKLYSLYARSVQIAHYSKSKNPGSIDTQQAIYLAACDVFVTEDKKQRNMLRLSVPLGHKKGRFGIIRCS